MRNRDVAAKDGVTNVSTRSSRKAIGKIAGCPVNKIMLTGPPKGTMTLVIDRGAAQFIPKSPRVEIRGKLPEIISSLHEMTVSPVAGN